MSAPLIILLHGVGASGASLAPLAEAMAPALPGVAFATPDGVEPFDMGGPGRQWFSVKGVTAENRAARVAAARPAFDATLDRIIAEHGARPEHVALLGFSQGTIMSLDLLADKVHIGNPQLDDLIVVFQSGAYGASASPQRFLSHPEVVEVLV